MFIKTVYSVKESRYVPVDWCMSKEECRVGRYHERSLEAGVPFVLEEFDCFDFVGVHNTYESLMADVLDYSLENEECDFDFVDIDNELSAKLDNNQESACFIFCDGNGKNYVFDFEQFNIIAEWDIKMHLKSVLGDDIDSEDIVDVLDVFFDLFDEEELKWVGDNGEPTEVLQQSGWSFQDDEYNKLFSEFIEEAEQLDLVELTEGMASGDVLEIHDGLKIKKE